MRRFVHTEALQFRISGDLAAEAKAKAQRQGMSVSELLRHAVRREVRENA